MPLTELAGTVLRESITATRDQPPFDRVTMDGIAIASTISSLRTGRSRCANAGPQASVAGPLTLAHPTACSEVTTGTMMRSGWNCVVPVDNIDVRDGVAQLRDVGPARVRNGNLHS